MAIRPLTNTQIKQAKEPQTLRDGGGLQLRITANGSKRWQLRYTNPLTKKIAEMSLGGYPEITIVQARKFRESAKELLAKGLNPKEERDKEKKLLNETNNNTLQVVYEKWFDIKKTTIKENTARDLERSYRLHVLPYLGNYPISELTAPIVIEVFKRLEKEGKFDIAKRLCQRINELMTYSVNTGVIRDNPLSGINKAFKVPKVRHNPSLKPHELHELMSALSIASIKIITRILIEWQLHTMVRPGEAVKAKWEEIDLDNRLWIIPAETMKTKMEHRVPLTDQTLHLLALLTPISGRSTFLFPSNHKPAHHANESTVNVALKRMGFHGRQTAHGLRALARTTLEEEGFNHQACEACLAHKVGTQVSQAYNHATYINKRKEIMAWWSEYIESASLGNVSLSGKQGLKAVNN